MRLSAICNSKVVVTTNVDQLLEQQYRTRYGYVLPVTEEEQLRLSNPYPSPKLIKLHGDLHHPSSLVLTESDYDSFLDHHPLFATWLANELINKTAVLIGYSLDDPDFRSILSQLRARLGNVPPDLYVLDVDADPVRIARYERRGVRVVNVPSSNRGWTILEDLFKELSDYWAEHVPTGVTSTTTIGRMVVRARTRLSRVILFLVKGSRLSDYNENVFLNLTEQGLLPVTEEDVQRPEGNELAALDLLLNAANQVVVEVDQLGDPNLEYAVRTVGKDRVLVVLPSTDMIDDDDYQWRLQGPSDDGDWKAFSDDLVGMLRRQWEHLLDLEQTAGEIQRLLDAGQYHMAFLKGVVELEGRLNRLFENQEIDEPPVADRKYWRDRPRSFRELLMVMLQQERIPVSYEEIQRLVNGRNRVVHGQDLPPDELRELTELVLRLLTQLPEQ